MNHSTNRTHRTKIMKVAAITVTLLTVVSAVGCSQQASQAANQSPPVTSPEQAELQNLESAEPEEAGRPSQELQAEAQDSADLLAAAEPATSDKPIPPSAEKARGDSNKPEAKPTAAQAFLEQGRAAHAKKDYDQAIAHFTEALRVDPTCAAAYVRRARAYQAKGRGAEAIADDGKALQLNAATERLHAELIAAAGFNDAKGINSNSVPGSPYSLDTKGGQWGIGEPGWTGPWTSESDGSQTQKQVVFEGDGALFLARTDNAKDGSVVRRGFRQAGRGILLVEQYVRIPSAGGVQSYVRRGTAPSGSSDGPVWKVAGNEFRAFAGDGNGGGKFLNTGFKTQPGQWHKATVKIDVATKQWEFYVDDERFTPAQPLGFRGNVDRLDTIKYLCQNPSGIYIDALRVWHLNTDDGRSRTQSRAQIANNPEKGKQSDPSKEPLFKRPTDDPPTAAVQSSLEKALSDKSDHVRLEALESLRAFGPKAAHMTAMVVPLLQDHSTAIRQGAAITIHSFGPEAKSAIPALREVLKDKDAGVRLRAMFALRKLGAIAELAIPTTAVLDLGAAMSEVGFRDEDARRAESLESLRRSPLLAPLFEPHGQMRFVSPIIAVEDSVAVARYVVYGSLHLAQKAQSGDQFDRLEAEEQAKAHQLRMETGLIGIRNLPIRVPDRNDFESLGVIVYSRIGLRLDVREPGAAGARDKRGSLSDKLRAVYPFWATGTGYWFLTKDGKLRACETNADLGAVIGAKGILYLPDGPSSELTFRINLDFAEGEQHGKRTEEHRAVGKHPRRQAGHLGGLRAASGGAARFSWRGAAGKVVSGPASHRKQGHVRFINDSTSFPFLLDSGRSFGCGRHTCRRKGLMTKHGRR